MALFPQANGVAVGIPAPGPVVTVPQPDPIPCAPDAAATTSAQPTPLHFAAKNLQPGPIHLPVYPPGLPDITLVLFPGIEQSSYNQFASL